MNKYYFTFGHYPDKIQIIYADTSEQARGKMFELHGKYWGFQYSNEEWQDLIRKGLFRKAKYLPTVSCNQVMTTGEMQKWTSRLNQILGAAQVNKQKRLEQLRKDFLDSHSHKTPCPFTLKFYSAVLEVI